MDQTREKKKSFIMIIDYVDSHSTDNDNNKRFNKKHSTDNVEIDIDRERSIYMKNVNPKHKTKIKIK